MEYIVLDLEWNQPWPGSPSAKKKPLAHGEVLQVGAVKLENGAAGEEFQVLIRPHFYKRVNRKVSSLTGLKDARLKAEGVEFPAAADAFRTWCGPEPVFLTWGPDDLPVLRENLEAFGLDARWTSRWYNAQLIFNSQTDGQTSQRALKTAMEMLEIPPSRPAHDALGDAYHTAKILEKLNVPEGIGQYEALRQNFENGFHGAQMPGCLGRRVYHGLETKQQALEKLAGEENLCPVCGKRMTPEKWHGQRGSRYSTQARCQDHGEFFIRVRLSPEESGLRAVRLIYEGDCPVAQSGRKEEAQPRRRLRRRSRKKRTEEPKPADAGQNQ